MDDEVQKQPPLQIRHLVIAATQKQHRELQFEAATEEVLVPLLPPPLVVPRLPAAAAVLPDQVLGQTGKVSFLLDHWYRKKYISYIHICGFQEMTMQNFLKCSSPDFQKYKYIQKKRYRGKPIPN